MTAWLIIQYVPGIGAFATDLPKTDDFRFQFNLNEVAISAVLLVVAAGVPRQTSVGAQSHSSRLVRAVTFMALGLLAVVGCLEIGVIPARVVVACHDYCEAPRPLMVRGLEAYAPPEIARFLSTGIFGTVLIALAVALFAVFASRHSRDLLAPGGGRPMFIRSAATAGMFLAALAGGWGVAIHLWTSGWRRLSPFFAEVPWGDWSVVGNDWLWVSTLAVLLVTGLAYRVATSANDSTSAVKRPRRYFYYHEQRVVLFLVGLALVVWWSECLTHHSVAVRMAQTAVLDAFSAGANQAALKALFADLSHLITEFSQYPGCAAWLVSLAVGIQFIIWSFATCPTAESLSFRPLPPDRFATVWLALTSILPAAGIILGAFSAGLWLAFMNGL